MGHTDYFYDPLDTSANADIRKKASEFIANVTSTAKDKDLLRAFLLQTAGITADTVSGKFEVALGKIIYK
jgi:type IV secretory pathway TrbF-like protein